MTTTNKTKSTVNKVLNWLMPICLASVLALCVWMVQSLYEVKENVAVMRSEVDGFEQLKKDVSTALVVLGQHGDEFENVAQEQLRIRTVYDDLQKRLAQNTDDRFTGSDGIQLQEWLRERMQQSDKVRDLQVAEIHRRLDHLEHRKNSTP